MSNEIKKFKIWDKKNKQFLESTVDIYVNDEGSIYQQDYDYMEPSGDLYKVVWHSEHTKEIKKIQAMMKKYHKAKTGRKVMLDEIMEYIYELLGEIK